MGELPESLLASIEAFLDAVPVTTALSLCDQLRDFPTESLASLDSKDLGSIPFTKSSATFCRLARECYGAGLAKDGCSLADWLSAMVLTEERKAKRVSTELIWTGPVPAGSYLRKTDQALQEVINEARYRLLVVSFAVYKVAHISRALSAATRRDVKVDVVIENAEDSALIDLHGGNFTTTNTPRFWIWPESKRPFAPNGYRGAMHAKCAVADDQVAYISSANLTEFALSINMEVGLLIRGGPVPTQIRQHFDLLLAEGILGPVDVP